MPPPLRWSGVPTGAAELALVVEDLDAPHRRLVRWVAWGIEPARGMLPEGVVPAGVQEGRNGLGTSGYRGPCPPVGDPPHWYRFTLSALRHHLALRDGATARDLRAATVRAVLATARLVGRYAR